MGNFCPLLLFEAKGRAQVRGRAQGIAPTMDDEAAWGGENKKGIAGTLQTPAGRLRAESPRLCAPAPRFLNHPTVWGAQVMPQRVALPPVAMSNAGSGDGTVSQRDCGTDRFCRGWPMMRRPWPTDVV
jgi:hypothetical protein